MFSYIILTDMDFQCPQCAASFTPEIENAFVYCNHCGNSLFIDVDTVTAVVGYTPQIDSEAVSMYLKRDFEKIGFNEKIKIVEMEAVFCPFWQVEGEKKLVRASSQFPVEAIPYLSARREMFDAFDLDSQVHVYDVDKQPETSHKRILFFVPFFRVVAAFKKDHHPFFVNAMNGEVHGDPVPMVPGKRAKRLLPLFVTILVTVLVINFLFDNIVALVALNLLIFLLFYLFSVQEIEKT